MSQHHCLLIVNMPAQIENNKRFKRISILMGHHLGGNVQLILTSN